MSQARLDIYGDAAGTRGGVVCLADGTTEPISDVEVGDQVLATNPRTGRTEARTVTATMSHDNNDLLDLTVKDGDGHEGVLKTTDHHRIWDVSKNAWVLAANLADGDHLHQPDGTTATLIETTSRPGTQQMLDLTIEHDHTFYADYGDDAVLVHNNKCVLSDPNPVTNRAIRNEYEEIVSGNGTPRIDPSTGEQAIYQGRENPRWAGAKAWDVPGTNHRILDEITCLATLAVYEIESRLCPS